MGHYMWYARKLALAVAVKIIKEHIRGCKNLQINTDSEDEEFFLSYDLEENRVAQARDNVVGMDVQDTTQIDERTTTLVSNLDIRNINMIRSPDLFNDELYNSGPSTYAHTRLIEQLKKIKKVQHIYFLFVICALKLLDFA
uniref:Uncharacterized protein n=1 Tax=Glossina pallidipes TaxID=7398 RepID=A0A1A9ZXN6_GLOPL